MHSLFAPDHIRYEGVRPCNMFAVFYKTLFLIFMSYPMWRAGTLAGSPAEEMTSAFLWTPLALIAVPWGYVLRTYVLPRRTPADGRLPSIGSAAAR